MTAASTAHEADELAIQRAELGRRVVRHVAGAQLVSSKGGGCGGASRWRGAPLPSLVIPFHPISLPVCCPKDPRLPSDINLQSPDLANALQPLPVHIGAPRAWATLTDGVAARGQQALRDALSPRPYPVPSFHTLAHCRCCLTSSRVGRRFRARPLNLFLALLFEQVGRLPSLERWRVHCLMVWRSKQKAWTC